jgi:hypothetical protein
MKSAGGNEGKPKELAQLLRLRQVQVDKAEELMRAKRRACEEAREAVKTAEKKLEDDKTAQRDFAYYMIHEGATDLARMGTWMQNYRTHLGDVVVQSEGALVKAKEFVEQCEAELKESHAQWLRETARRDGVEAALKRSRAAVVRAADLKAEAEVEELVTSGPMAASKSAGANKSSGDAWRP